MRWAVLLTGAMLVPAPALAACKVQKILELPVTMAGRRPMVTAQLGGRDVRFILDSGAFYSTISRANATEFGLSVQSLPPYFRLPSEDAELTRVFIARPIMKDFLRLLSC